MEDGTLETRGVRVPRLTRPRLESETVAKLKAGLSGGDASAPMLATLSVGLLDCLVPLLFRPISPVSVFRSSLLVCIVVACEHVGLDLCHCVFGTRSRVGWRYRMGGVHLELSSATS